MYVYTIICIIIYIYIYVLCIYIIYVIIYILYEYIYIMYIYIIIYIYSYTYIIIIYMYILCNLYIYILCIYIYIMYIYIHIHIHTLLLLLLLYIYIWTWLRTPFVSPFAPCWRLASGHSKHDPQPILGSAAYFGAGATCPKSLGWTAKWRNQHGKCASFARWMSEYSNVHDFQSITLFYFLCLYFRVYIYIHRCYRPLPPITIKKLKLWRIALNVWRWQAYDRSNSRQNRHSNILNIAHCINLWRWQKQQQGQSSSHNEQFFEFVKVAGIGSISDMLTLTHNVLRKCSHVLKTLILVAEQHFFLSWILDLGWF